MLMDFTSAHYEAFGPKTGWLIESLSCTAHCMYGHNLHSSVNLLISLFSLGKKVHCNHGHVVSRSEFQRRLGTANPKWSTLIEEMERTGEKPRTNPDGDVRIFVFTLDDVRGFYSHMNMSATRWS